MRPPWETLDDKVRKRTHELAIDRIVKLERALTDVLNSYEDERARIKAGNADRPSVSGQTFIDRARRLLSETE